MPSRCQKGTRRNKKTGLCESTSTSVTDKKKKFPKCSKGTRRNNKTGECVKIDQQKSEKKKAQTPILSPQMSTAKFYKVAADIFPKYEDYGTIPNKYASKKKEMIQKYVDKHRSKFHPGDILFVGSATEGRQNEQGYVIITNDGKLKYGDNAVSLPLLYRSEIPAKISYSAMLSDEFDNASELDPFDMEIAFMDFFSFEPGNEKNGWQDLIADYEAKDIY